MRKLFSLFCACLVGTCLLTGCASEQNVVEEIQDNPSKETNLAEFETLLTGKHIAEINVKDYGTITVELDADIAPITVTNFVTLAQDGFYDGLTFHRIISDFMIQGGDPLGNGTGGADQQIIGEFLLNGIENDIPHVRGTISMARSQDYNSASSQFFIVHQDSTYLDSQYAAFGHVTQGMEVVDAICAAMDEQGLSDAIPAENQPVIESITILE